MEVIDSSVLCISDNNRRQIPVTINNNNNKLKLRIMTNEDYQLEELENAAVNKSNNAKRIAAAAGLLATGGAAGYAATNIQTDAVEEPIETLTEEDLESVADTGANQVQEPQANPQPVQPQPQSATPEQPTPPAQDEVDVSFDKTTHYYDEDNNLIATTEEGTVDGKQFTLVDVDGDQNADVIAYDVNGNGAYEDNEIEFLEGNNQIAMGHEATQHEDHFIAIHEPEPEPYIEPYDINEEKDYADNTIHNDFEDEKTGENYSHDYAENNEDYNNGEVEHYSADSSDDSDYAYEDDIKDESDYEYNDLAENDAADDTFDDLGSDSLDIV